MISDYYNNICCMIQYVESHNCISYIFVVVSYMNHVSIKLISSFFLLCSMMSVDMSSAVLFILRYRLLLYSAGSGVNRVKVVLSGFSVRLFCFDQLKLYVGMVVCISWLHSCLCV